jgi:hypothetical protein
VSYGTICWVTWIDTIFNVELMAELMYVFVEAPMGNRHKEMIPALNNYLSKSPNRIPSDMSLMSFIIDSYFDPTLIFYIALFLH